MSTKNNLFVNFKFIIFFILFSIFCLNPILAEECVEGDCENGKGVYVDGDGIRYEGNFVDGYLQGKREKITLPDGSTYEGKVVRGLANGKGLFIQKSGEKYLGYFKDGHYHGQGRLLTVDGDFYEGEFKSDKYDGMGYLQTKDGFFYVGKFKNGKKYGKGTLYKKMYDGIWKNDVRTKE